MAKTKHDALFPDVPNLIGTQGLVWAGLICVALLVLLVLIARNAVLQSETRILQRNLDHKATLVAGQFNQEYFFHVSALKRYALRWEQLAGNRSKSLWDIDATALINDMPGFQSLSLTDSLGKIIWVTPLAGNEKLLETDLSGQTYRNQALDRARTTELIAVTKPLDFVQGGEGVLMFYALQPEGRLTGFVSAAFNYTRIARELSQSLAPQGYLVSLKVDDRAAYNPPPLSSGAEMTSTAALYAGDGNWSLQLRMSAEQAARQVSILPQLVLYAGLGITLLVALIFLLWIRSIQARNRMLSNEERYRFAIESSGGGIWDWNARDQEIYISKRWKQTLGYDIDEPIDMSVKGWEERLHPADKQRCLAGFRNLAPHKAETFENEYRVRCKDGSYRWILDHGKVVEWNAAGKPLRAIGTFTDVHKRKLLEIALDERRKLLRTVLDNTPMGIWRVGRNNRLIFANQWFCKATGIEEKRLLSLPHYTALFDAEAAQQFMAADRQALASAGTQVSQQQLRYLDGTVHDIETTRIRLLDDHGDIDGFIGMAIDVSERNKMELAMRSQEQFLRQVINRQSVATFIIDAEHRVIYWNHACETLTGLDAQDMVGKAEAWRGFYPAARPCLADLVLDGREQEAGNFYPSQSRPILLDNGWHAEAWFEHIGGKRRFVIFDAAPIFDENGVIKAVVETLQDVTETKRIELELEQHRNHLQELVAEQTADLLAAKTAAETASQTKSLFLANMSHEMRTPMHAILSFSEMGETKGETVGTDKLISYFQRIRTSGERLMTLLNNLLDLSKLQAGKMVLDTRLENLWQLVFQVVDELEAMMVARRITLVFGPVDFDTTAPVDTIRFMQVVRNLLSNAIKFTPEGGVIELRFQKSTLPYGRRAEDKGEEAAITLEIIDNGIGIPEEDLDTIFDQFIQSSKTKTGAGGTGLGLSICREITLAHRGTLLARNNDAGGATFALTLPLAERPAHKARQSGRRNNHDQ